MKQFLAPFFILFLFTSANATDLVQKTALDGKISLLTPMNFSPMSQELLDVKYPSSRKPTEVLSNESGNVNLAFNHTNNKIKHSDIKDAHSAISTMFHNLYPSAEWKRDEVIDRKGQLFIVMELITPAIDTKIHNIIYGTSVDDRFLLVAFNTTKEESNQWLSIGKEMMDSLIVN